MKKMVSFNFVVQIELEANSELGLALFPDVRAVQTVEKTVKNFYVRHCFLEKLVQVDFVEFFPRFFVPTNILVDFTTVKSFQNRIVDLRIEFSHLPQRVHLVRAESDFRKSRNLIIFALREYRRIVVVFCLKNCPVFILGKILLSWAEFWYRYCKIRQAVYLQYSQ